jgi:UDP-N-acetyl-D-glucosamine dehydrogenase
MTERFHNVVVVGQGYVGLPLAISASHEFPRVFGLDVSRPLVDALSSGVSHIDSVRDAELRAALARGYTPTLDQGVIMEADAVIICVPTPLSTGRKPDLSSIEAVAKLLAHTKPGVLVVLESTSFPGTTEEILLPPLASRGRKIDQDFFLAFSPERIDPGNQSFGVENTPRLVGGVTERSGNLAAEFYGRFVGTVLQLSGSREAEMAKLIENTYRHVNIALVNELLRVCRGLGIDFWEAQRGAATKPFGFQAFWPSSGVGGHCIPIDPQYLLAKAEDELDYTPRFIDLANQINNSMPRFTAARVFEELGKRSEDRERPPLVLVLGVSYKPNISDMRESSVFRVIDELQELGAVVFYHDPLIAEIQLAHQAGNLESVPDPYEAARSADCVLVLQAHSFYDFGRLKRESRLILDASGSISTGLAARI